MTAVQSDGALQPALSRLEDMVYALVEPTHRYIAGKWCTAPSLYMQLWDATAASVGEYGGVARSLPPVWIDSVQLRIEIDTAVEAWHPQLAGVPPTVGRLRGLTKRNWRPQDTRGIEQIADACEGWVKDINTLLDPPPRWTLPAACPRCMVAVVRRKDSGGELVRQPALQLSAGGCRCIACQAFWPPLQFTFLASLLGYEKPLGVVDG